MYEIKVLLPGYVLKTFYLSKLSYGHTRHLLNNHFPSTLIIMQKRKECFSAKQQTDLMLPRLETIINSLCRNNSEHQVLLFFQHHQQGECGVNVLS